MPERHRDRQLLLDQLQHADVAKIALAEIEPREIPQHQREAFRRRLVEAELLFQALDEFRIEPLRAAIFRADARCRTRRPGPRAPKSPPPPEIREVPPVSAPRELRDHPLHRAARRELHHHERHEQDSEQRRDHQENAAGDIGAHELFRLLGFWRPWRRRTTKFSGDADALRDMAAGFRDGRTHPNRRRDAWRDTIAAPSSGRRGTPGRRRGRRWSDRPRLSAAMAFSISASIAGLATPARLYEPLVAAACDEKIRPQAVARRRRHAEALDGHVEIEIFHAGAVLHGIDQPQAGVDPERPRFLMIGRVMRLERRLIEQEFDREGLAVRQHPLAVLDRRSPASASSCERLAQQRAVLSRTIRHRRHERLTEYLVRHLAAKRLEQLELFRRRRPVRHHVRILERRMGALIGAVHDGLVGPFEIERLDQRFAHPRILELARGGY